MGPAVCQLAQSAGKPGLGLLLAGTATAGGVISLLSASSDAVPSVSITGLQAVTAAVQAAMSLPGMAITTVLADRADAPSTSPIKGATARAATDHLAPEPPKSFLSLFSPSSLAVVFAKNIGLTLLIRFNLYMVQLNDYEYKRMVADEQGTLPPEPPQMGKLDDALTSGTHMAVRELATSAVKIAYERLTLWRLGPTRSKPFLRNGPSWVIHVLTPRHQEAGSTTGTKVFSYTFALLHANALFYAAECTVSVGLHTWMVARDKHRRPKAKAAAIAKGVFFHTTRCTLLLISTSAMSALGTLARPGFGTRAGLLITDQVVNMSLMPAARAIGI